MVGGGGGIVVGIFINIYFYYDQLSSLCAVSYAIMNTTTFHIEADFLI